MNDKREEKFEESVERWGREFGRKAEEWGRHVERKAEEWADKMERRAERRERWAERREGRRMRREGYDRGRKTTLYRSRSGSICGVCKGIAEYYDFSVGWTRIGALAFASFTGVWPAVFLYVVAAMVMKPEPVLPLESEEDEEFYQSYSGSRTMALHRLKRTYDNLNRRIQRLENTVTARDFDWDERLNR